ncbi:MAG: 50S ribosomal protein L3 [Bacteriovoracaceae bacterium]|nr:50S ribosomal protein L3 [Bacteriovoracaceae bacterium]
MSEENKNIDGVVLPAFYGVKAGMTRVFDKSGNHVPVTVIKLIPNFISQVKTKQKDGYEAYQIAYNEKRERLINKPTQGQLKKANIQNKMSRFSEIPVSDVTTENLGKPIALTEFKPEIYTDVTGISKGKGFQGVIKRYNFSGGPAAHGSHFHRTTGSIGNRATPGKVFAGKKMPGHMGNKKQTIQNILVHEVNLEKGYMLLRGSVPGSKNSIVKIVKATKK